MARNKVQFQKGLSEAQFAVLYGTEDQCREAVMRWRWPSGFVCPVCAGEHHSFVREPCATRAAAEGTQEILCQAGHVNPFLIILMRMALPRLCCATSQPGSSDAVKAVHPPTG